MNKNLFLTLIMNSIFLKTTIAMEETYESIDLNDNSLFSSLVKKKHAGENLSNIQEAASSLITNLQSYYLAKEQSQQAREENILANRAILTLLCGLPNQSTKNDNLSLIIGPMFAGKTTSIIDLIEQSKKNTIKYLVISPSLDNRCDNKTIIQSHDNKTMEVTKINFGSAADLNKNDSEAINSGISEFVKLSQNQNEIYIDEGQFIPMQCIPVIQKLNSNGTRVIVDGLNLSFDNIPLFSTIALLSLLTNNIDIKKGTCDYCKTPNSSEYSYRTTETKEMVEIGNHYAPVCSDCLTYNKELSNKKNAGDYLNSILDYKTQLIAKLQLLKKVILQEMIQN